MNDLPTGTVTFLFTDIEGSTPRWEGQPATMMAVLGRQEAIIRDAAAAHGGSVFKTVGDSCYGAFAQAQHALAAAVAAQRGLLADDALAGLRVRMALHTGSAERRDADYFGPSLNRVARLLAAAHGGQVLLTQATEQLVRDGLPRGVDLIDHGEHRLKDLSRPERIFQVVAEGLPSTFPPLRTARNRPHNLPYQPTSFVGRTRDTAALRERLSGTRLLTLSGVGGVGKTRLALQTATAALDDYPEGVWFVDLAPIVDAGLVPQTIAEAVGVRAQPGRPALATLVDQIRAQRMLIVLDNCEHVVEAAAAAAAGILAAAPRVVLLATSREPLAIGGEAVWPVQPLGVPDAPRAGADAADPAGLAEHAAVRLFVDRATAARPDFAWSAANAPAVAAICRRLDGLPLAIELAAARVTHLPPEQILARLHPLSHLPAGGRRTAARRQQTLAAALDWSHDLLDPVERALFRRLSAFRGGWTLEAMEAVCTGESVAEDDVLDTLGRLVDKSLVAFTETGGEGRYRFLETVRAYARAKRIAAGEQAAIRTRHMRYFMSLSEVAAGWLAGPEQATWAARLDAERDNLRAALDWADRSGDAEAGQRLCAALWRHWLQGAAVSEGLSHTERALREASGDPTPARAMALLGLGALLSATGDDRAAIPWLKEGIAAFRHLGDPHPGLAALPDLADAPADVPALFEGTVADGPRVEGSLWRAIERALGDRAPLFPADFALPERIDIDPATGADAHG